MCFIVVPLQKVQRLCASAQNVQALLDDGTLADSFTTQESNSTALAVTAFDILSQNTTALLDEQKEVSPFLRYRKEILGNYETAGHLRGLVMNLWGGREANLGVLFMNADQHHTRIALECIASYTRYGQNDIQFMGLASEIRDLGAADEVAQ